MTQAPSTTNIPAGETAAGAPGGAAVGEPAVIAVEPNVSAPPAAKPDLTFSKSDVDKAVAAALKDSTKKIADAEARARLSEEERTKLEMTELRNQIKERDARDGVMAEAARLGVKNPSLLYRAIKDGLDFAADGSVSNLKDVLDSAKTDFPELFDTKPKDSIDAGAGSAGSGQSAANNLDNQIRKALGYK